MKEQFNNPELQELVDQYSLSLNISKDKKDFPIINIAFPLPSNDLSSYNSVCQGCGKAAEAVLEEDVRTAWIGVKISFQNLLKYRVEGCELDILDGDQFKKAQDDFFDDKETSGANLLNSCIEGTYIPSHDQRAIVGRVWGAVTEILREHDIKMRPERPPLVSKVRSALIANK